MLKLLGELQAVELPDEEELTAATLMELVSQVMAVGDPADMASIEEGASLHAQINYHTGKVGELEDDIGEADGTTMDQNGDLNEQLRYYMGRLGTPSDAASNAPGASLYAQLNYRMMRLGDPTDPPSMEATASVYAQLNYYKKQEQDEKDEDARDMASSAATALIAQIAARVAAPTTNPAPVPTLAASSDSVLTAESMGYTPAGMEPDMIDGWRGAMLTSDDGDTIVAYTNIKDATATPLGDEYSRDRRPGMDTRYPVESGDTDDIMWTGVTRESPQTSSTEGDPVMTSITFDGMVGNVPGMFSCTAGADDTACAAPARIDDGVDTNAAGAWFFTPDDAAATVDVAAEGGHLVFGWWLSKDADGEPNGVDVFTAAIGEDDTAQTARTDAGSTLAGTAKYSGGAAGKWALHSLTAGQNSDAGHWTASAELTANFDASTAAVGADTDGVMVSGEITEFSVVGMDGDPSNPGWKVTLMALDEQDGTAGIQSPDDIAGIGAVAEWDIGGNLKGTGDWTADFYGTEDDTNHPTAVTGQFDANIGSVGAIIGAFGATKEVAAE